MRLLLGIVILAACGGSRPPPPAPVPAPVPAPAPAPVAVIVDAAPVEVIDGGASPQVAVASDPEDGGLTAGASHDPDVGRDAVARVSGLMPDDALPPPSGVAPATRYGIGGGHRVSAHADIGTPKVKGQLDVMIIQRYLGHTRLKLQYCYEHQLVAKPGLAGTVTAKYTIDPDGVVKDAKVSGVDDEVDACVATALDDIEYPKPRDAKPVRVTFTVNYAVK